MAKVKAYVNTHSDLFLHGPLLLNASKVTRKDTTAHSGLQSLIWEQHSQDLPVFDALFKANLGKNGEILALSSTVMPGADAAVKQYMAQHPTALAEASIVPERAIALAAANVGQELDFSKIQKLQSASPTEGYEFYAAPGLSTTFLRKTWLPMDASSVRLVWQVTVTTSEGGFLVAVDAETGEAHLRTNLTASATPQYRVWATESPTPMSPGFRTPAEATSQPPEVSRELVTIQSLDSTASPNGWINDGENTTSGNNVSSYTDMDDDDKADYLTPVEGTGPDLRTFDFPADLSQDPINQGAAAMTNVFYWTNWMHDKLYGLGFTETSGNFQTDNFGRNGPSATDPKDNDAVRAQTLDSASIAPPAGTRNDAKFTTYQDGIWGPRMQMYLFTYPNPDRNSAFVPQVILHEYAHGLSDRLMGGTQSRLSKAQTVGMGEGWSDFYALSLLGNPGADPHAVYPMAAYLAYQLPTWSPHPTTGAPQQSGSLTSNYYYGLRSYPYCTDMKVNPLTFRDSDPGQLGSYPGVPVNPRLRTGRTASGAHERGEVWCTMLWEARARMIDRRGYAVGNNLMLQLVTDGMKLSPANPNFVQARDAIIQADLNTNGGANASILWNAFAKRGLGKDAVAPSSDKIVGAVEDFDVPASVDATKPLVWFEPLDHLQQVFEFSASGPQAVAGMANEAVRVTFSIEEHNTPVGGANRYWNGSQWITDPWAPARWLEATVTGFNWVPAAGINLPLHANTRNGEYILRVRAVDNGGNVGEDEITVIRSPAAETTPPIASITYPTAGGTIAGLDRIGGNASDPGGGSGLTGAITLRIIGPDGQYWNGNAWASSPADVSANMNSASTWEYRSLPKGFDVRSGGYHVTARAFDWNGNVSASNSGNDITFTVNPALDTTPPSVTISSPLHSPAHNSLGNKLDEISGTAADTGSGLWPFIALTINNDTGYWNGTAWTTTPTFVAVEVAANGTWEYTSLPTGNDIRGGTYALSARSYDFAGNLSTSTSGGNNILYVVDIIRPDASITGPSDDVQYPSFPALNGTADDSNGIPTVTAFLRRNSDWLYWNGYSWVNDPVMANLPTTYDEGSETFTGNFTRPVLGTNASDDSYNYTIIAFDRAGNSRQRDVEFSVITDTTQPTATISTPSNGSTITSASIAMQGTASDASGILAVECFVRRNSDGAYWNGTGWGGTTLDMPTNYNSGTGQWTCTGPLPKPGFALTNGDYTFIAIATDNAGLYRQVDSVVTVNYSAPSRLAASHVDFSNTDAAANGTVGKNGWRYGYFESGGASGIFSTAGMGPVNPSFPDGPYPSWNGPIGGTPVHTFQEMHPGHPTPYAAVRRYQLNPGGAQDNGEPPHSGPVRVVGRFYDMNIGATDGFISVNGGLVLGPARIGDSGGTLQPGSRREGGQIAFDFTVNGPFAPGSTFDFGVTTAGDNGASDATGFVAWLMTDDTPVPTNIVANAYHSGNVPYPNNPDGRGDAFVVVTDERIGSGNADCFDTYPAPGHPNQFAGLLYLEQTQTDRATRFDRVRIDMGTDFGDGGDFSETPRLFLLRHNSDPGSSDPTTDERYVETNIEPVKLTNTASRPYYEFDLTLLPQESRTGYGFAVVGPGVGTGRHISVSEIEATATRVTTPSLPVIPKFREFGGHRYALTITRGTWQQCEDEAVALGGHLVAIGSAAENEWLVNTFGAENLFVGLRRSGSTWSWCNGDALAFTSWGGDSQPNNGPLELYGMINTTGDFGRWHDTHVGGYPESSNYRGIIELPNTWPGDTEQRLTVSGRSIIFGAGHNVSQTFPAVAAAAPVSGSIPPPYAVLGGTGNRKVTFTGVGGSIFTGADTVGPDGGRHPSSPSRLCDIAPVSPPNGISGYKNLSNVPALVGVFLTDAEPTGTPPARLDFSQAAIGQNFSDLLPQIGQVFFIGNGRASTGTLQQFVVPPGATRLYLGFPDAYEGNNTLTYTGVPNAYADNTGSFVANFYVEADPVPHFVTGAFPGLNGQFSAVGGSGSYTWSVISGDFPPHLQLQPDGSIVSSGQPVVNGVYSFTIMVADSSDSWMYSVKDYEITVEEPVDPPSGIVAWWPGENAVGEIVGGHHGATWNGAGYAAGRVARGFNFDGVNDVVQAPHAAALNLPGDLTIEGWIRHTANSASEPMIVSKQSTDGLNVAYSLFLKADGRLAFASRSSGVETEVASTVSLPVNTWHHVAVTIGGGQARFYADGQSLHVAAFTAARPAVTGAVTLGAAVTVTPPMPPTFMSSTVISSAFPGSIDELTLYNRALSPTEIASLASASGAGKARHDLAIDFDPTSNSSSPGSANLPWVYGSMPAGIPLTSSAGFVLHDQPSDHGTLKRWHENPSVGPGERGGIQRNESTTTNFTEVSVVILPRQVSLFPSEDRRHSAARWIAPSAGTYAISSTFTITDKTPRLKDVVVLHNGSVIFSNTVSVDGDGKSFTSTRTVAEGDTMDFVIGPGDSDWTFDNTGLAASVVRLGPPTYPEIAVEMQASSAALADQASSVFFGTALQGGSTNATFVIRNTGDAPLTGLSASVTGSAPSDFNVGTFGSTSLLPGESTALTVIFTAGGIGARYAELHISSNDPDESPFDITIYGSGREPVPGTLAFQNAEVSVNEANTTIQVPIVRTGGSDGAVDVRVNSTTGSATLADFDAVTNALVSFGDGETSKTVPVTIRNDAVIEPNETFTLTLSNPQGGATLGAQQTVTIRILDVDPTPPSVIISTPAASVVNVNSRGTVNVTGTATDNKGVKQVRVSLNGGPFVDAVITPAGETSPLNTSFALAVTPQSGTNTVSVKALDHRNNISTIATRTFSVWRPLAVNVVNPTYGSVTAGFSPSSFREVGKSYTITATPKPPAAGFEGGLFTGWTVSGATNAEIAIVESAKQKQALTFIFREGLQLTANFIPNFFAPLGGSYNGLIRPSAALPDRSGLEPDGTTLTNATEGRFSATVQNTGAFSATMTIDGLSLVFSGAFDELGVARFGTARLTKQTVPRANKPSLTVALQMDTITPGDMDRITGIVVATDFKKSLITAVSEVEADRAFYNGTTQIVPAAYLAAANANGNFTAILPAKDVGDQPPGIAKQDYPQGAGVGTITVTKSGVVIVTGTLADGSPLSASSALSQTNTFPLFSVSYDKLGFLSGYVQLDNTQPDSDMAAQDLKWLRPFQGTSHYYPDGWQGGIKVDLQAAKYAAVAGQSVLKAPGGGVIQAADADGNVVLEFSDGQLAETLNKVANLGVADAVTKVPDNDLTFNLTINRTTGAFSGLFDHTDDTKPTHQGVIYQKGANAGGYGYFLTKQPVPIDYTGQSGGVRITGAP